MEFLADIIDKLAANIITALQIRNYIVMEARYMLSHKAAAQEYRKCAVTNKTPCKNSLPLGTKEITSQ
jgi:hypothetical protein